MGEVRWAAAVRSRGPASADLTTMPLAPRAPRPSVGGGRQRVYRAPHRGVAEGSRDRASRARRTRAGGGARWITVRGALPDPGASKHRGKQRGATSSIPSAVPDRREDAGTARAQASQGLPPADAGGSRQREAGCRFHAPSRACPVGGPGGPRNLGESIELSPQRRLRSTPEAELRTRSARGAAAPPGPMPLPRSGPGARALPRAGDERAPWHRPAPAAAGARARPRRAACSGRRARKPGSWAWRPGARSPPSRPSQRLL
jgi:hypothetical protein